MRIVIQTQTIEVSTPVYKKNAHEMIAVVNGTLYEFWELNDHIIMSASPAELRHNRIAQCLSWEDATVEEVESWAARMISNFPLREMQYCEPNELENGSADNQIKENEL